ncbi:MAG: GtrA family protein [Clostridia bacterium]|nr:GtrA family protein [Oscillospiraceae bacterium]MBQ6990168.1 GtrA family protein [Clostridia bacterium]MBR6762929.1 GtrA family protein [Clostridia bacterium]
MKRESLFQVIKFTLFSASAGIIQTLVFTLLNELAKMQYWPAYLISLVLSVLWNFTLNRKYTFKSAANVPIAMAKTFGFYLVFTPLSTWLGHLADQAGINEYIIFAVTLLTNFVTEFLFTKFVVYRGQENTAK